MSYFSFTWERGQSVEGFYFHLGEDLVVKMTSQQKVVERVVCEVFYVYLVFQALQLMEVQALQLGAFEIKWFM